MALETHDLALALRALDPGGARPLPLAGYDVILLRAAAGERIEHDARAPGMVLVLEGLGTIAIDDWRATLAGGHLAAVPAKARLVASADAGVALALLFVAATTPAPEPVPATP